MTALVKRDAFPLNMELFFALQVRVARNVQEKNKEAGQLAIVSGNKPYLSVRMNEKARDYGFLSKHAVYEVERALCVLNVSLAPDSEKVALIGRKSGLSFVSADQVYEADKKEYIGHAAEAYKTLCLGIMKREYNRNHKEEYPNTHAHSFWPEKYEWLQEQISDIVDREKQAMIDELDSGKKHERAPAL